MTILTEGRHTAEFIISEAAPFRSRDQVTATVAAGATLEPGTILATITASGKRVPHDADGTDNGTRTATDVLFHAVTNPGESPADFTVTVMARDCEVQASELTYDSAADGAAKIVINAALAANGIIVR